MRRESVKRSGTILSPSATRCRPCNLFRRRLRGRQGNDAASACNVEIVAARAEQYRLRVARPESVFVPPIANAVTQIKRIEESLGPLPLSLRAFYEVVGSVDFTQSSNQLISYNRPERSSANELQILGEDDPLVVTPLSELAEVVSTSSERRVYFRFADDEFHKANYSGGENYHVWLPDPRADFEIIGMYEIDERFVEYLRATCCWGGFRGQVETLKEDESRCRKVAPKVDIVRRLAEGLLPI